jgi:hypothetical protein
MSPSNTSPNADEARITRLIEAYFEGETSLDEERELRRYFAQPAEQLPDDLRKHQAFFQFFDTSKSDSSAPYEQMMDQLPAGGTTSAGSGRFLTSSRLLQLAAGIILVLSGFIAGMMTDRLSRPAAGETEIQQMRAEVQQLQQVLISGAFHNASAGDRIRAARASAVLGRNEQAGYDTDLIIQLLAYSLNTDPNVHVRTAAAEALYSLADQPMVPETLLQSLSGTQDEMIQLQLVEMLTRLEVSEAVSVMRRLRMHPDTSELLARELDYSIAQLESREM